jgi:hypothetical protein
MYHTTTLRPADLLFDLENPRIPHQHTGQREILCDLARRQDKKLSVLAEDIVSFRLSPAELPIVMASIEEAGRYVVLDGNRRLTAIKVLERPDVLKDTISPTIFEQLRKLSVRYQQSPIEAIECVVVKNRDEAEHWLFLRHNGQNEGAGIVTWGSDEKARFLAGTGGQVELHTRLLNFLEDAGNLMRAERQQVPVTNLKRLIESPAVRARLGIEVQKDGSLHFSDEATAIKGLLYIINDIVTKTKVKDIYTKEQRVEYANRLPSDILLKPDAPSSTSGQKPVSAVKPTAKRIALARLKQQRDRLIPSDCILQVSDAKLKRIERELRTLSLKDYANAATVLFRVFIELSLDSYVERMNVPNTSVHDKLSKKLEDVTNHLKSAGRLSEQASKPVKLAWQKGSYLSPSIVLMHEYIHNLHMVPSPSDLLAHWDSLQPFVVALWAP